MSFDVGFDGKAGADEDAWAVCSGGGSVDVTLRWERAVPDVSNLEPKRRRLDSCKASLRYWPGLSIDRFGLPSRVELHRSSEPDADPEIWVAQLELQAPRWVSLGLTAEVEGLDEDGLAHGRVARATIIPRRSAIVATTMLAVALIALVLHAASILASLQLTLGSAVPGLSGAALLSFALTLASRVGRKSFPHMLPVFGIPYVPWRAALCIALGALGMGLLSQRLTSVRNDTEAQVDFALPGRTKVDRLAPGAMLTYPKPIEVEHASQYLDEAYVLVGPPGARRWGTARELHIECAPVSWKGVADFSAEQGRNDKCEIKPLEQEIEAGQATYTARYPWSPDADVELLELGVDAASKLSVEVEAPPGSTVALRQTVLDAGAKDASIPIEADALRFAARIASSNLVCERALADRVGSFTIWSLPVAGVEQAVARVVVASRQAGWASTWTEGTTRELHAVPVCSLDDDRSFDELRVWVDEAALQAEEGLSLDLGVGWSGRVIEVRSIEDEGLLGRLECSVDGAKGEAEDARVRVVSPALAGRSPLAIEELKVRGRSFTSTWTREGSTKTRPWLCLVGADEGQAQVRGVYKDAKLAGEHELPRLIVEPKTCYIDADTGALETRVKRCPEGHKRCEADVDPAKFRGVRGGVCELLYFAACVEEGRQCKQ